MGKAYLYAKAEAVVISQRLYKTSFPDLEDSPTVGTYIWQVRF